MKEKLYELYKNKAPLSKNSIDMCTELPSYNTLCRKGYKLVELNMEFKERLYVESPKICKFCSSSIEYCSNVDEKIFCNHSCAASYNNQHRAKTENPACLECSKPLRSKRGKFCGNVCQSKYYYTSYITNWLAGNITGCVGKNLLVSRHIRKYLHKLHGTACSKCGWDEKHPDDESVLTEIDHIDGNAGNNRPENLRILCPNCHSMTSTFRARNKKSKRKRN